MGHGGSEGLDQRLFDERRRSARAHESTSWRVEFDPRRGTRRDDVLVQPEGAVRRSPCAQLVYRPDNVSGIPEEQASNAYQSHHAGRDLTVELELAVLWRELRVQDHGWRRTL